MVTVMKIIDLSHTIAKTTPVFPGSEKPQLATVASYEKDGYRETLIRMYSHTGTHIDPPAHVYEKGLTLDALPLTQFIGQALVIDCRHRKSEKPMNQMFNYIPHQRCILHTPKMVYVKT